MQLTWINNPRLDNDPNVLDAYTTSDEVVLLTGNLCASGFLKDAMVILAKYPNVYFQPGTASVVGGGYIFTGRAAKGHAGEIATKSVTFSDGEAGKVALTGQAGAADCDGMLYPDKVPLGYTDIVEFNSAKTFRDRVKKMQTRAEIQTKYLVRKIRQINNDRAVHSTILALGLPPKRSLWDYRDKALEDAYAPWVVSKAMGDLLLFRDGIKTRIHTLCLYPGAETFMLEEHSPTLTFVGAGGGDTETRIFRVTVKRDEFRIERR